MASQEPRVWINGALAPADQARISPWDLGFTNGHGAYETLRARDAVPFAVTLHWKRLEQSCRLLGIPCPSRELFLEAMTEVLSANGLREARVRFTVSGGEFRPGSATPAGPPALVCTATPAGAPAATEAVVTVPWVRNERSPLAGAKSLSYGDNLLAMHHARSRGAGEAIFSNTRGELCEGTATNVFLVRDGVLHTPPLSSGCLPGVTRALVLHACRQGGLPVAEETLCSSALSETDEAFLTSSLRDVQPISSVDGKPLSGSGGTLTRRAAGLFRELAASTADPTWDGA